MRKLFSHIVPVLAFVASLALVPAKGRATTTCFPDWSDAAPIVARENLLALRFLQQSGRQPLPGDIIRATLCLADGNYVYRLVLREESGRITHHVVDAQNPGER